MAIIDILTHYDAKKKAAHAAKTVKHGVSVAEVHITALSFTFWYQPMQKGLLSLEAELNETRKIHDWISQC